MSRKLCGLYLRDRQWVFLLGSCSWVPRPVGVLPSMCSFYNGLCSHVRSNMSHGCMLNTGWDFCRQDCSSSCLQSSLPVFCIIIVWKKSRTDGAHGGGTQRVQSGKTPTLLCCILPSRMGMIPRAPKATWSRITHTSTRATEQCQTQTMGMRPIR